MSNTGKIIVGIIVVVVLGALAWAYFKQPLAPLPVDNTVGTESTTTDSSVGQPAPVDTSDASIDQDVANLDTQISNLNSDSASIDAGASSK